MPLADATAISFLSIIVTLGLSVFMLKERAGPRRWGAAIIALIGALLITRPGTSAFQPVALIALLAAVFIGFEIIFIKQTIVIITRIYTFSDIFSTSYFQTYS